ncbi:MAG: biopolymer transporter ExbD [Paracoccaceae bacterium]
MDFSPPSRRSPAEPFVPMINVVFLLLIFFLMTAQIASPEPFEVVPPTVGAGAEPTGQVTLHASPEGELGFGDLRHEAAIEAAIAEAAGAPLRIRADAKMEAASLAGILTRLSEAGIDRIEIVATPR